MKDRYRTATVSSTVPFTFNEDGVELNYLPPDIDQHSVGSDTHSSSKTSNSIARRLKKIAEKFEFLKVEKRGIDRVGPEDRTDSTIINTAILWMGANFIVPSFALGALGPAVFQLSLYDSIITIIIFNMLGIIPIAAIACFGPVSGLRTMVFTRYSWGYYGASIISVFNIINALGWAAVNSITGAQTLRVVSNDTLSLAVGIIIIAVLSMIVSFVGYRWIHIYERYSWIPVMISYCIVAGVAAKYFAHSEIASSNSTTSQSVSSGLEASNILSFGSTCFGNAISWCSFAADYTIYFPEDTSHLKVFIFTYLGNFLSMIPVQLLGAAAYTGTYTNPQWAHAYEVDNAGGLLGATLSSLGGFGKFLLVLFALSTVAGNIPNIYSLSLSAQVVAPVFKRVPRFLYTVIGTTIYVILGIVAANHFNSALTSFMDIVSYWFAIYIAVVFEEHLFFRRCSFKNYAFDIWNNRKALPISVAAIMSGLIGVAGIVLGMSQTWFSGPIAKAISGDNNAEGANIGFEIAFIFTAVTYPIFRLIEYYFLE